MFSECEKDVQWDKVPWTCSDKIGQIYLRRENIELYLDVNCVDFNPSFNELFERLKWFVILRKNIIIPNT